MDKLKALFGTDALTFEQLEEKLKDNKEVKLANLASGNYVDKKKFDDKVSELGTANQTITDLQNAAKKFDGVDIDKLKTDFANLETKYNTDIEAMKVSSMAKDEIIKSKAKNPAMVLKLLDMSAVKRDGDKLIGLSDQLDTLKKSDAYAFDLEEEPKGPTVNTGGKHGGNNNTDTFMSVLMSSAGIEPKGE